MQIDNDEGPSDVIYDAIIVGAGPGGCSTSHTLVDEGVDPTKILILERGPSLQDFKDKTAQVDMGGMSLNLPYTSALVYGVTQSDPEFREDVNGTPIVLGRGIGGGTNHFSMQFIDQKEVSDMSVRQPIEGSNITEAVDVFASFADATSYSDRDYNSVLFGNVRDNYQALYDTIDANLDGLDGKPLGKSYRNKVYKKASRWGGLDQPRLLVGDLIPDGVEVKAYTEVKRLVPGEGIHCVDTTSGQYCGKHILLAANPLNSVRLALNAEVVSPSGMSESKGAYREGLYDHQGYTMTYVPPGKCILIYL